jgi:hypothetical protein
VSDGQAWGCILTVLLTPMWIVVVYGLAILPLIERCQRRRCRRQTKMKAGAPAVTFGLDPSWFRVDPQKLREWREMNRRKL